MPTENSIPDAVILANGNFPTHPLPLTLLKNAKHVICCDGATNEYVNQGFIPNIIVGDGDSLTPENKARFANIIYYSSDPETNDLTKAVDYCISQRMRTVYIVGATGKREDHAIGNISLLLDYMDMLDDVMIITDYGVFNPIKIDSIFEAYAGQPVSVISLKAQPLRGRGLKYPLSTFTNWWQGTLNVANTNPFTLLVRDKTLVYRAY
ncbi:thiamine diphosphokinase [Bacteroides sp. 51]|uniref:thiamine diphosphokinase n=1 Tax=Bacteroides sp. 51 TaxID=2302938 RepID=UPI0013D4DBFE|nr:thiamine diphosphokinase [Bacteroides sp. 51]NDV84147.1 thiamine diphosphokinase [Bacteroides sp. 51]